MTVCDELAELMRVRLNMDNVAMGEEPTTPHDEQSWQEHAANVLRDHGPALLEALDAQASDRAALVNLIAEASVARLALAHCAEKGELYKNAYERVSKAIDDARCIDTARRGGG